MKIFRYYLLIILIVLSTSDRIGSTYLSFNLMGITVRYSHILCILPAVILIEYNTLSRLLCTFIAGLIISGIYNDIFISTLAIVISVLFSYYIFYLPALSFTRLYPDLGVRAILQSSRIILLIGIVLQFTGQTERMGALFYEPSYMSIFMAAYASLCFTESKLIKPFDFILMIIFLYSSKSAAFILIIFSIASYLLIINKYKFISLICIYVVLLIYYLSIERINLNYNIIEAVISLEINDLIRYSIERSGERFNLLIKSFNEAISSPIFGIGPRAFQDMYDGTPPTNIFIQIILESGILGFFVCIFAIKSYFHEVYFLRNYKKFITCTSIALFITLQLESTYMRAYLWIFFGIFNGIIVNNKIKEITHS